jgi:ribonuclease G
MNKELFVSSTPHETKVGLMENDQLAEIYLERENEYTLAGSIYKGRVTRVLPGMQSAFVDVGLERDAFLYVSDFLDLEDHDEDMTETVPTPGLAPQQRQPNHAAEAQTEGEAPVVEGLEVAEPETEPVVEPGNAQTSEARTEGSDREERGQRGRRRRGGRRDRNDRNDRNDRPDRGNARDSGRPSREPVARLGQALDSPAPVPTPAPMRPAGPPAGYQPILLPGESLSKYKGRPQYAAPVTEQSHAPALAETPLAPPTFRDDEPFFAASHADAPQTDEQPAEASDTHVAESHNVHEPQAEPPQRTEASISSRWTMEYRQPAVIEEAQEPEPAPQTHPDPAPQTHPDPAHNVLTPAEAVELRHQIHEIHEQSAAEIPPAHLHVETVQETADEEEVEAPQLHAHAEHTHAEEYEFDEFEEETRGADGATYETPAAAHHAAHRADHDHAAHDEGHHEAGNGHHESGPVEGLAAGTEPHVEEADDDEEFELEEAQAEAEAMLAAEQGGAGEVSAEAVHAAAGTAARTQRTPRPAWERRSGQRGPRRGGRPPVRRQAQDLPKISDLLKEGQEILVQIAKEPIGKKGARITSHIALPGRFLVYMPTVNHTGVSRKIASDEERQRLKRIVMSERDNGVGGFIVRTAAARATEDELRADIRFLKGLWNDIKSRADAAKPPALIYHDLNVVERVLRDLVTSDFGAIWVDNEPEYERILRFFTRFQPALVRRVKLYTKETPLFEQFGLAEEMNKALRSKVWLKSGGYIVINQTEALVAIDINTGKYVGKTARLEDTIVKTNIDAIKEIVRQVRLRDLGGIIIIDFIDMDERRNRQRVMQALEEEMRLDRAPSKVLQFNDFGLVAITRKRVKQSLERTLGAPCPYCESTGYVKSVTTVCNELYVEMRKIAKHLEREDVMLRVHPDIAKELKANNARLLTEMEEMTKRTIIIKSDPALHQEKFDIN